VQATLRESVSLLLLKLMEDKSLLRFEEGATLVKAVNVLMLKILEARCGGGWVVVLGGWMGGGAGWVVVLLGGQRGVNACASHMVTICLAWQGSTKGSS
jgi:hypothetical protein